MRKRTRRRRHVLMGVAVMFAALFAASTAHGHPATERYIPLGLSPGVSYKQTTVGVVEAIDPTARTITLSAPSGPIVVPVTDQTRIWLDQSKAGRTSLNGAFTDLTTGATVEVKFTGPDDARAAEWIKMESSAGR